jgi:hypothetical protein
LRSTREARLTKREEQWKAKNNRKKIGKNERTQFAQNLAPTSRFDCFWRMRIKSNYGTIDPYLVNHIGESEHQICNRSLCTVTPGHGRAPGALRHAPDRQGRVRQRSRRSSSTRTRTT